ncbi:DUF817 domain-containing protein [Dokdonella koreensis]|nr:DUF817 domain-containing protein [Dokdonella koreensis]
MRLMREPRFTAALTRSSIARVLAARKRPRPHTRGHRLAEGIAEFLIFGCKQAWACVFGGAMVALIVATHLYYPHDAYVTRYDFLFLAALTIQGILLGSRLETVEEAKVILMYHLIGTAMEVFKTEVGSWSYPEAGLFRIGGVPLFSGFMYAAIGSYIARCWRLFDFRFTRHPPIWALGLLALAIYVNFYTHHRFIDLRVALFAASAVLFGRCWVHYRIWRVHRRMPLLLGLFLVALFVWIAENLGTWTRTWTYPHQTHGWSMVRLGKLGSWFLLLVVSYTLIAAVSRPRALDQAAAGRCPG